MKRAMIAVTVAAATLALAGPVSAQQNYSGSMQAGHTAGASHFSDKQVRQFAAASRNISKIRREYSGKLHGVQDKTKAQHLQQEAAKKMTNAVRNSGLTVSAYNHIASQINRDPDLRKRVMAASHG